MLFGERKIPFCTFYAIVFTFVASDATSCTILIRTFLFCVHVSLSRGKKDGGGDLRSSSPPLPRSEAPLPRASSLSLVEWADARRRREERRCLSGGIRRTALLYETRRASNRTSSTQTSWDPVVRSSTRSQYRPPRLAEAHGILSAATTRTTDNRQPRRDEGPSRIEDQGPGQTKQSESDDATAKKYAHYLFFGMTSMTRLFFRTSRASSSSSAAMSSLLLALVLLVVLLEASSAADANARIPFWSSKKKRRYTPLVFFTVPKGLIPECDAMERAVRDVERELGVRVERLDVLRDPSSEAALALLTQQKAPPFLYNRESCQTVHVPSRTGERGDTGGSSTSSSASSRIYVDKARVRAWAKGRYLPAISSAAQQQADAVQSPVVLSRDEDKGVDQDELLSLEEMDDMALTPLQRKGKQAIKERTAARAAAEQQQEAPEEAE